MTTETSLYDTSRFAVVGSGADRVRVCIAQVEAHRPGHGASVSTPRRVLLIHGNPSHLGHWARTVPVLREGASVLAYDQPGLGRSDDFADARHSLERSVDTALAILDHQGWTAPVDVIGQSHGGLVGIGLAARAPERVRSLALVNSAGIPASATYRLFCLPGLESIIPWLGRTFRWLVRAGARSSFRPDPVPASVVAEGLDTPPTILRTMVRLARDRPCEKVARYGRRVRAPVLFLHAREDHLVKMSSAQRLRDCLRDAGCSTQFVEIDGGHMVHLTRPAIVNRLLTEWLGWQALAS